MASGYGRGGRGAALLQALNAPVRKPGESPGGSPTQQQPTAQPQAFGRGAMLQQFRAQSGDVVAGQSPAALPMGRGQMMSQSEVSPGAVTAPAPPLARGRAALLQAAVSSQAQAPAGSPARPLGRGALAMQAVSSQSSAASTQPGSLPSPVPKQSPPQVVQIIPPSPITKGSPIVNGHTPALNGHAPATVNGHVPATVNGHVPADGSGDQPQGDGRPGKLEYMLQQLDIKSEAVVKKGIKGQEIPVCANYIPVRCANKGVYQYSTSFSPSVDSKSMRFRFMNEHVATIGEVKAFDGAILFLPIRLPQDETVLKSIRPTDDQEITIRIKLARVLPPASCVQLYNVVFRRIMSILKMCQVGRQYYDPYRPAPIPQHRLEVWPGYVTAVAEYEGGLMMLTDVSHRVLRTETILDIMADTMRSKPQDFRKAVTDKILGKTVLTRYNNKTYHVDDIMWDKNPLSTFTSSTGAEIAYAEYYKKNYNKVINDLEQPLLVNRPKEKDKERQRGNRKPLDIICLVPELCYITGLTDEIRADFRIMKDLAVHTRVSPAQRQFAMRKFCENVNTNPEARAELAKWGLSLDMDTIQLMGRKLPIEQIYFKKQDFSAGQEADWGRQLGKDHCISAVELKNWLVVHTKRDGNVARDFIQCMQQVSPSMGWQVARPATQELMNDRTETYLKASREALTQDTQVIVAIFPTSRDDRYNAFKKLCCVEAPVPSQVINARTISKKEKLRSVVQKITLQINCKLGGELWAVKIPTKGLMVCGIDTYHAPGNKRNSIGGFVASMNQNCTRWYSRVCHQMPGQELIDGLKMCLLASLRKYHEVNHTLPERIMVYRDGVGDGQLSVVGGHEVQQLASCFPSMGENYQPKLGVIVVQKRINTRIFACKGRGRDAKLENPPPGTVMDHTVTRRNWHDFFLVSQHVRQGTVTPTHYVVVHDDTGWSTDLLQLLSYKMTHMYYNWPGTVRVPAPCQYAHKLAYQVGQNLHKDPSTVLSDRLFYL